MSKRQSGMKFFLCLLSFLIIAAWSAGARAGMRGIEITGQVPPSEAPEIAAAGFDTVVIYYNPFRNPDDKAILKHLQEWGAQAAANKLQILVLLDTAAPLDAIADAKTLTFRQAASDDGYPMEHKPAPLYAPFWQSVVFPKIDMLARIAAQYPVEGVLLNLSGHVSVSYDAETFAEFLKIADPAIDPAAIPPQGRKPFLTDKGWLDQFIKYQEDKVFEFVKAYLLDLRTRAPKFEINLATHNDDAVHRAFLRALKEDRPSGPMVLHEVKTGVWKTEQVPAWDVDWIAEVSVKKFPPLELAAMAGYTSLWAKGFLVADAESLWVDLEGIDIHEWPLGATDEYLKAVSETVNAGEEKTKEWSSIIDVLSQRVAAQHSGIPKVALIYSGYMGYMYRDIFDAVLKEYDIKVDKYENSKLDALVSKLDQYDLVITAPAYNAVNSDKLPPYGKDLMGFVEKGGFLLILDATAPPQVQWIGEADPELKLASEEKSGLKAGAVKENSKLLGYPNKIDKFPIGKYHFAEAAPGWSVLAKDNTGAPYVVQRLYGQGMIIAVANFEVEPTFLENAWEYMLRVLDRFEVKPDQHARPLGMGLNQIPFVVTTFSSERPLSVQVQILNQYREIQTSAQSIVLTDQGGARFSAPMEALKPGFYRVTLTFTDESRNRMDRRDSFSFLVPDAYELTLDKSYYTREPEALAHVACRRMDGCDVQEIKVILEDINGNDLSAGKKRASDASGSFFALSLKDLKPGDYNVAATVQETGADPITITSRLKKLPPGGSIETKLLNFRGGLLEVNGKPYFPVGIYSIPPENLKELNQAGVNGMIYYGNSAQAEADMNAALQGKGILFAAYPFYPHKMIYNEDKTALVQEVEAKAKNNNMFAWYLADEPELFGQSPELIADAYSFVREIDPYRPQAIVMMSPDNYSRYVNATDIFMFDRYPTPVAPQDTVGLYAQRAVQAVYGRKPVFAIPQAFDWRVWDGRFKEGMEHRPNYAEMRSSAYQCIAADVKGIIYWAFTASRYDMRKFPDHVKAFERLMKEIASFNDVLMEPNAYIDIRIEPDFKGIDYGAKIHDGKVYIFTYNGDPAVRDKIKFILPQELAGRTVTVNGENRTIKMQGAEFTDSFDFFGVHLYVVQLKP